MDDMNTLSAKAEPVRQWLQTLQLGITDALQAEEDAKGSSKSLKVQCGKVLLTSTCLLIRSPV